MMIDKLRKEIEESNSKTSMDPQIKNHLIYKLIFLWLLLKKHTKARKLQKKRMKVYFPFFEGGVILRNLEKISMQKTTIHPVGWKLHRLLRQLL